MVVKLARFVALVDTTLEIRKPRPVAVQFGEAESYFEKSLLRRTYRMG